MSQDILFTEIKGLGGDLGIATLNRPQALNALNHEMIFNLHEQLKIWEQQSHIKGVIIRAVPGRAFCAGGDIRLAYERAKEKDARAAEFFYDEYLLNRYIFHYPKPYVALLDGITMGGGVGISLPGSHCVGTENLKFAMPETGIGFFPDVGGTYFLPRLPQHMGYYLGLTGQSINVDACVQLGICTAKVNASDLDNIINALAHEEWVGDAKKTVSLILKKFAIALQQPALWQYQHLISSAFANKNMEDILQALANSQDVFAQQTIAILEQKSPTSLKVSLRAMQEDEQKSFDEVMQQSYRLAVHFLEHHDFIEGIRAQLIDKDKHPQWQPAKLSEVTPQMVEAYFAPVTKDLIY